MPTPGRFGIWCLEDVDWVHGYGFNVPLEFDTYGDAEEMAVGMRQNHPDKRYQAAGFQGDGSPAL